MKISFNSPSESCFMGSGLTKLCQIFLLTFKRWRGEFLVDSSVRFFIKSSRNGSKVAMLKTFGTRLLLTCCCWSRCSRRWQPASLCSSWTDTTTGRWSRHTGSLKVERPASSWSCSNRPPYRSACSSAGCSPYGPGSVTSGEKALLCIFLQIPW